ncbi:hypothetical protein D1872_258950 [compost metagenome]
MLIVRKCSTRSRASSITFSGIMSGSFITRLSPTAQCSQRILHRFVTVISTLVSTCRPYSLSETIGSHGSLLGVISKCLLLLWFSKFNIYSPYFFY